MRETCLFYRQEKGELVGIIAAHVNDIRISGTPSCVQDLMAWLGESFEVGSSVDQNLCVFWSRNASDLDWVEFGMGYFYIEESCEVPGVTGSRTALGWGDQKLDEGPLWDLNQHAYRQSLGRLAWIDRAGLRAGGGQGQ